MTRIMVTGAAGVVGRALLAELAQTTHEVIACDETAPQDLPANARFYPMDVTTDTALRVMARTQPEVVVHLAGVMSLPQNTHPKSAYAVEVEGTRAVVTAALAVDVKRVVIPSSEAAYGYHADNPVPLRECHAVRGNKGLASAHNKRLIEEFLAEVRENAPQLEQVVLRVGTVLGRGTHSQITDLFQKPRLLAVRGATNPFVFVWQRDLARILLRAATDGPEGTFNVAGDGALTLEDLSAMLGKPVLRLPAWLLRAALFVAHALGLTTCGPEQVRMWQYRPILSNAALKRDFGYTPEKTSREVFEVWQRSLSS